MPYEIYSQAQVCYPAAAARAACAASNAVAAWNNNAYGEIVASLPGDRLLSGIITQAAAQTVAAAEIDVATGAAGAEVVIATFRGHWPNNATSGGLGVLQIPVLVDALASGARVAARIRRSSNFLSATWYVGVLALVKSGTLPTNTTNVQKVYPAAADNVSITVNTTAWANSAYAQMVASTASAIQLTGIVVWRAAADASVDYELDIATGSAGAESVVTTHSGSLGNATSAGPTYVPFPNPVSISTATRIAVRIRKSGTNAIAVGVALTYI